MSIQNQNIQNPQDKIMFNYEQNFNPFMKKRSLDDSNVIGNILDELGESRISFVNNNSVREDP